MHISKAGAAATIGRNLATAVAGTNDPAWTRRSAYGKRSTLLIKQTLLANGDSEDLSVHSRTEQRQGVKNHNLELYLEFDSLANVTFRHLNVNSH